MSALTEAAHRWFNAEARLKQAERDLDAARLTLGEDLGVNACRAVFAPGAPSALLVEKTYFNFEVRTKVTPVEAVS